MGRLLLVALVCLAIGFFAGRTTTPAEPVASTAAPNLTNLQSLADVDLAEYYRLKTLEERYRKADEILGKMIGIFLADLGLRVSSGIEIARQEPPLQPSVDCTPVVAAEASTPSLMVGGTAVASGSGYTESPATPPSLANRPALENLRSDSDIAEFLKTSEIKDFDSALKSSFAYANRIGIAGKFRGEYTLKFAKNGRVFSNKSGNGNLGDEFREWKDDPEVIFIEASPDTFLQAYYLKGPDALIGNVVEQTSRRGPYSTIGTVRLNRN